LKSIDEMTDFAERIAVQLRLGDVLLLKGDLGTGKSTFARALIQKLCGKDTEVPSPTFTLVQTYDAPELMLWHFDLYRLEHPEEVDELGIEDAYHNGVSLIEWPERLGGQVPRGAVEIEFKYGVDENERTLSITGWDDRSI